ncbi:Nramp family divalent metal transporter [uncultured Clostridium sp.]|uniref:Nramp family divalent metal transporter n=1 Tax=uncultured Clostridium sp. TaxID=59620 RepID=UPI002602DEB4|nr:Nramp family divalent metal transporter [uncultured Clostridium sp.]
MKTLKMDDEFQGKRRKRSFWMLLAAMGPGITVMLADTDAGSIITAAQSGAQWGYKLILLNLILVPMLYFVQELTTRLGITTGKGHGELIKEHMGKAWAWIAVVALFVSTVGALITEFSGMMGVGLLFGVSKWIMVPLVIVCLILLSATGKYKTVERVAIVVGLFELVFIPAMIVAHPDYHQVMMSLVGPQPLNNGAYWLLIAANVGAVIMPWMVFYQQGAVVDKKLTEEDMKYSKIDTAVGSVVTQLVVVVVIIAVAATIGKHNPNASLNSIQEISEALTPFLGNVGGKVIFAIGISGAALIAAIVVSLAASWGFGELFDTPCSLDNTWREAPVFYAIYCGAMIVGGIVVLSGVPLVPLTLGVEVLNTLLLPLVLGLLLALGWKALPKEHALKKWEKIVLIFIYVVVCGLGVATIVLTPQISEFFRYLVSLI